MRSLPIPIDTICIATDVVQIIGSRLSINEWRQGDVLSSGSCPQHVLILCYTGSSTHC